MLTDIGISMEQKQISELTEAELLTARAEITAQLLQIQLAAINQELERRQNTKEKIAS